MFFPTTSHCMSFAYFSNKSTTYISSTLKQYACNFSLLYFSEAQFHDLFKCIQVVLCTHDSNENAATDIRVHALLSGQLEQSLLHRLILSEILCNFCLTRMLAFGANHIVLPRCTDEPPFAFGFDLMNIFQAHSQCFRAAHCALLAKTVQELFKFQYEFFICLASCSGTSFNLVILDICECFQHKLVSSSKIHMSKKKDSCKHLDKTYDMLFASRFAVSFWISSIIAFNDPGSSDRNWPPAANKENI